MYRANSKKAEEFISHDEILDTLKYAEENAGKVHNRVSHRLSP